MALSLSSVITLFRRLRHYGKIQVKERPLKIFTAWIKIEGGIC